MRHGHLMTFHVGSDGMTVHQSIRSKPFNQQIAAFGEQILFKPHKTTGPQQKLAVNWTDGCWFGFNTRMSEHSLSSIRRRNTEERWNFEMLLGILGNPWSLQDGRVESRPCRTSQMPSSGEPGGSGRTTATRTRNEENGRRLNITKKMVSEFRATGIFKDVRFYPTMNFGHFRAPPSSRCPGFTPPEILANFGPISTFSAV